MSDFSEDLVIYDDKYQIIFGMDRLSPVDSYWDEDVWVDEFDGNQVEISFRQDEPNGWGVGGGEYISTSDIKAMADCIRSVINKEKSSVSYMCQDDLFRIELSYDSSAETYTFTASLLEILIRDHYITVTKSGLTRETLEEYIAPFFIWERKFPVISDHDEKMYHREEDTCRILKPDKEKEKDGLLCDEPVLKTYHMQIGAGDEELWEPLDYSKDHAIVYHAIPGYWLVLETEHYFFSIGADGLKRFNSMEELKGSDREIWNDVVTSVEEVVFPGERIHYMEDLIDEWAIFFDDFMLFVEPHNKGDGYKGTAYEVEKPFFGFRHVLKNCECGPKPRFMMNRQSDFYVYCRFCHKATKACYDADVPVADWNAGRVQIVNPL